MERQRVEDLEIDQDLAFQRRFWRIQRGGWVVMVCIVLATLLGVFGAGPLSDVTTGEQNASLHIAYHRFARYKAPTKLQVQVAPGTEGTARLWLTRSYLNNVEVKNIIPPPDRVEASADRLLYVFPLSTPGESAVVVFYIEPEQFGALRGQVGLEGGASLSLYQFIYP